MAKLQLSRNDFHYSVPGALVRPGANLPKVFNELIDPEFAQAAVAATHSR